MKLLKSLSFLFIFLLLASSCKPTKRLQQDQNLLDKVSIKVDNKQFSPDDFSPYLQQRPNKQLLGARFHLWLYNCAKPHKNNWFNNFLRKNGEEPVIFNPDLVQQTHEQLTIYLEKKGYYQSQISDSIDIKNQRAHLFFNIKTGKPYTINHLYYNIADSNLAKIIFSDTINSLLQHGKNLDIDLLDSERKRIETSVRNNGYYSFSVDNISFVAEKNQSNLQTNLILKIPNNHLLSSKNTPMELPFPIYKIRSVAVNADMTMEKILQLQYSKPDSQTNKISYNFSPDFLVKQTTVSDLIFLFPDSIFNLRNANRTHYRLQNLQTFRQISINFNEVDTLPETLQRQLDCTISLLPSNRHSLLPEIEATTSSEGNLGGGIRLKYSNRSLFRHAELFDFNIHAAVEAVNTSNANESNNGIHLKTKMEYEAEAALNIPRFLIPMTHAKQRFLRIYTPRTIFSILGNYQQRPELYQRTLFSASFAYSWRKFNNTSHVIKPLDINYVLLPYVSDRFNTYLNINPFLRNSYQSHTIISASYTFNRDIRVIDANNYVALRANVEQAGLLTQTLFRLCAPKKTAPYKIFNNNFSQFIKADIDLRHHFTINDNNKMISRLFLGVGLPYGNSQAKVQLSDGTDAFISAMPFEKKYYAGGSNSMRAWRLRSLGPGSYVDTTKIIAYPNNSGDIKIEMNWEYRFHLISILEGALFADIGNVWDMFADENRPNANFDFRRFYKEIALAGGIGLRIDLTYFILRADLGFKLRDPAGQGRWIFQPKPNTSNRFSVNDMNLSIGIGYPFL